MGSLPYGPLPRDDTKRGARPPLESPAYSPNIPFGAGYSRGAWGVAPLARGRSPLEKPLWVEGFFKGGGGVGTPSPLKRVFGYFLHEQKVTRVRAGEAREPSNRMAPTREKKMFLSHPPGDGRI